MRQILSFLTQRGVAYRQVSEGHAVARCPLHGDTDPSLHIYADGHYHCFGCSSHGKLPSLVRRVAFGHVADDRQAWRMTFDYLRDIGAITDQRPTALIPTMAPEPTPRQREILSHVSELYGSRLNRQVVSYLKRRGLTQDIIQRFRVGFCDGTPEVHKLASREELYELGLVNGRNKQTMFERITIPDFDGEGRTRFLQGRAFFDGYRLKYRSVRVRKPAYYLEQVTQDRVWIVESALDALVLWGHGEDAVAIAGTHMRDKDAERLRGKTICMAHDEDNTGTLALMELTNRLSGIVERVHIMHFGRYKDPGDLAEHGCLTSWLRESIQSTGGKQCRAGVSPMATGRKSA